MIFFLSTQPLWISGPIIVGLGTVLSMLGPILVRRYVALHRLTANNEIAGFKYATIGVLYAVLLAFAVIVVWERFSDAELDVVHEAGAAENIYRLSQGLSDNARVAVLRSLANYLKTAINVDWPTMDQGTAGTREIPNRRLMQSMRRSCRPADKATALWFLKCSDNSNSLRSPVVRGWLPRKGRCRACYGWSC
jgi:hypothetical protein